MNANITTKPELGKGMYTIPDAAVILDGLSDQQIEDARQFMKRLAA